MRKKAGLAHTVTAAVGHVGKPSLCCWRLEVHSLQGGPAGMSPALFPAEGRLVAGRRLVLNGGMCCFGRVMPGVVPSWKPLLETVTILWANLCGLCGPAKFCHLDTPRTLFQRSDTLCTHVNFAWWVSDRADGADRGVSLPWDPALPCGGPNCWGMSGIGEGKNSISEPTTASACTRPCSQSDKCGRNGRQGLGCWGTKVDGECLCLAHTAAGHVCTCGPSRRG